MGVISDFQLINAGKRDQAILVVSFGTSYNESRKKNIGAIERTIAEEFPEYDICRAFTSRMIIDKLKKRDGLEIDSVNMALDRAIDHGVRKMIVQPTHLMNGYEYMKLVDILKGYENRFEKMMLGAPLLTDDRDFDAVIQAITAVTASFDDGETAVCLMGHGTEAVSNRIYRELQEKLIAAGYENYYIGTVEEGPLVEELIHAINKKGIYQRVVLEPLMVVAGDHAHHDMGGDSEDSWKNRFESAGYKVECLLRGLGEIPEIRDIYVDHVRNAAEM